MTTGPPIFAPEYYERLEALERSGWWNAGMRDVASTLLAVARLPDTGVLLDAGCGSGNTMAWFFSSHPGWRVVGIDISLHAVEHARALPNAWVAAGSSLQIPLGEESVDLVVSQDVIQHLPLGGGDEQALREMTRVLKRGAWLFLRTNAQAFPHTPDDIGANFHKYELRELRAKLVRAGLRVACSGRVNAILGLAEIPRELRAARTSESSYHGLLAAAPESPPWWAAAARKVLGVEGRLVRAGWSLPGGRSIVALCQRPT